MFKRIVGILIMFIFMVSLLACKQDIKADKLTTDVINNTKFNEKEIAKAIDIVKNNFDFKGCTLKKVWYDEEKSRYITKGYLGSGKGSINNVNPENIIVLLSDFEVDSLGGDGSFEPNSTYGEWQWILIRDSKTSEWRIDSWGY